MKRIIIIAVFLTTCLSAKAQTEKEINNQVQFWTSVNSTWRFSDHWGAMGDFHIRRNDFLKDKEPFNTSINSFVLASSRL